MICLCLVLSISKAKAEVIERGEKKKGMKPRASVRFFEIVQCFCCFFINFSVFSLTHMFTRRDAGGVGGGDSAKRKCPETDCLLRQNYGFFGHLHF